MNKPSRREGFVAADEEDARDEERHPITTPLDPVDRPKEEWPIKVRLLYKKIRDPKGNQLDHLEFREPTGGDINRYGNPIRVNQEGDVVIDDKKMMTMMAVLCGVLQPFLEGMDPRDYCSCAYRLRNFFLPDLSAW